MTFEVVGTNAQIEFDNLESSPVIKHTNVDALSSGPLFSGSRNDGTLLRGAE